MASVNNGSPAGHSRAEVGWATPEKRQLTIRRISEAVQMFPDVLARNPTDVETSIFTRARSEHDYMNMVGKIVLSIKQKGLQQQQWQQQQQAAAVAAANGSISNGWTAMEMRPTGPGMNWGVLPMPPLGGSGTQWNPNSQATSSQQPPLSSSQPSLNPEEPNAVLLKLEELQCYIPLIARMIDRLQRDDSWDKVKRKEHLTKLTSLYNVLKSKNTKVPLATLEQCHIALKRIFEKDTSQPPTTQSPPQAPPSTAAASTASVDNVAAVSAVTEKQEELQCYVPQLSEDSSNDDSIRDKKTSAITAFEEIDQRYLQEAMKDGFVESSVTKTVVQGEARVGKSSVKSLLVSKPYNDNTSTSLIESPCVAVRCYGHTGKYWERINEEEMGIKVIAAVQSDAVKKLESHPSIDEMDFDSSSSAVTCDDVPVAIELTSDSSEKDAVVRVRKFYEKCKQSQKEGTSLHGRRWLYFIDSGGQLQFQKLLPAFMPYASVLLLVVNLSKNLSDPSSTAMQLPGREISVGQCSLSVIEILRQLLSAIASSAQRYRSLIVDDPVLSKFITPPSDKLKVLPVATHRDKYEEAQTKGKESVVDKKIIINKILHQHETCEIVGHKGRIYLYEVDGRKACDEFSESQQPDLYKIAQVLEDNAYHIKVPLKWYCFGVLLHDVAKEGCGVLSLSYCQELGQQLNVNLSPEESLSAIKFLSFLNKLLFYPDSPAGDLVFVNIESLINILRDLLVFVYDAHSDANLLLPDEKALVCKGHLSVEILKKASKSCNKISNAFSDFDAKLLGLFEYLLIATQLPEKDTFFMPALLPIMDVSDINPYHNTTPLLLYFEKSVPMGLFCAVIVHLLSHKESPWKVVEGSNFSNYFTLSRPGYLEGRLILVEQLDCITMYCKAANDYIPARDAVEEAVDVAMSKHKLSKCEKPKRAFNCPCDKGRHAAQAIWVSPQQRYILSCTIDEESQNFPEDCWNWLDQRRKRQHDEFQHLPDILETNIAYQVLVNSATEIKDCFSDDFSEIADKLLQMNVITERERSSITDRHTGQNKYQRMGELLELVKAAVKINKESTFLLFMSIFNEKGTQSATKFAQTLMQRYKDACKLSDANLESLSKRAKQYE